MIFYLPEQVPFTAKDPDEVADFFSKYEIMPYYGTSKESSHSILDVLTQLADFSPTFKSVRKDKSAYTFGLRMNLVGRARPGLALEATELTPSEQLRFEDYLAKKNIRLKGISKVSKRIDHHLEVSGSAYLIIRRTTAGDAIRYDFEVPHYKHVAYFLSKDIGEDFVLVSKWLYDPNRILKFPPKILRVTQEGEPLRWNDLGGGVWEALVHIKEDDDSGESEFYPRSPVIPIMTWLFTDYKMGSLTSKVVATDIITKKILAFEGPDPETEFEDDEEEQELDGFGNIGRKTDRFERAMLILKELTTEIGTHPSQGYNKTVSSIAGIEYPPGKNPPTAIDLEVNRDQKSHQWQLDTAIGEICAAMQWSPELISLRPTRATLGGNLYYDIFTSRNTTTIRPRQVKFEDLWNEILAQLNEVDGGPSEFENYGIQLPNVIGEMIYKLRQSSQAAQEQSNQIERQQSETEPGSTITENNEQDPNDDE